MRRFDRSSVPRPTTFDDVPENPTRATWNYSHLDKVQIRDCLHGLQGTCCAYCERVIGKTDEECHIEHLWRQKDFPDREADWSIMFLSCNTPVTCGKYKDGKYLGEPVGRAPEASRAARRLQMETIIDPSRDDPDEYLQFVSDGTVRARSAQGSDRVRAEETVKAFRLDAPILQRERAHAVSRQKQFVDFIQTNAPEKMAAFIEDQVSQLPKTPFASALRAYLNAVSR